MSRGDYEIEITYHASWHHEKREFLKFKASDRQKVLDSLTNKQDLKIETPLVFNHHKKELYVFSDRNNRTTLPFTAIDNLVKAMVDIPVESH